MPEDTISEDAIRQRSYQIWQREHCPQGRHLEHWYKAKAELQAEGLTRLRKGEPRVGQGGVYYWDHCG
jgi:hypothetical protein